MYAFVVYALLGATVLQGLRLGDAPALNGERRAWVATVVLILFTRLLEPLLDAAGVLGWPPFMFLMLPFCFHNELVGLYDYVVFPVYTGQHSICQASQALWPACLALLTSWPAFGRVAESVSAAFEITGHALATTGISVRINQASALILNVARVAAQQASTPLGSPNDKKLE